VKSPTKAAAKSMYLNSWIKNAPRSNLQGFIIVFNILISFVDNTKPGFQQECTPEKGKHDEIVDARRKTQGIPNTSVPIPWKLCLHRPHNLHQMQDTITICQFVIIDKFLSERNTPRKRSKNTLTQLWTSSHQSKSPTLLLYR
jgi:hypothetical protein